jgi:Diguanylate cyclase, GGDEF domain
LFAPRRFDPDDLQATACWGGSGRPVDIVELNFRLLPRGLEYLDGIGDVLHRVVGHHLHPNTGGSLRHRREFDQVRDQSHFGQSLADKTGKAFRSHLDADDRRRIAAVIEASFPQLMAKAQHVGHQCQAQHTAFDGLNDVECLENRGRLDGRQRVRECRRCTVVTEIFLRRSALARDEAAVRSKCLGEAAHYDIAERIRRSVAECQITRRSTGDILPGITVSVGVAQFRPGESMAQLLERCDGALYLAKRTGRNRVVTETRLEGRAAASA